MTNLGLTNRQGNHRPPNIYTRQSASFSGTKTHVYAHTREKPNSGTKGRMQKNKSIFEIIILRGVVLAFYINEICCEKEKLVLDS